MEQGQESGKDQALKVQGGQGYLGLWVVAGVPVCPSSLPVYPTSPAPWRPHVSPSPEACLTPPDSPNHLSFHLLPQVSSFYSYPRSPPSLLKNLYATLSPALSLPSPIRTKPLANYRPQPTGGLGVGAAPFCREQESRADRNSTAQLSPSPWVLESAVVTGHPPTVGQ